MSRADLSHCLDKIDALVASGLESRRELLQLGYNLGRLSELSQLGREPFWDAWKDAVSAGDLPTLRERAAATRLLIEPLLDPPHHDASTEES